MLFAMPSRRSSALIFVAIYRTSFSRSLTTDPALLILRRRAEKDWDFATCRARTENIEAQLEVRSEAGRGTTIVVHVAMNERNYCL